MVIVSNTSPIVNLAGIQHLHLLTTMFGHIYIPDAVYHEIVIKGAGQPGAVEVGADPRFVKRSIRNPNAAQMLIQQHPGLNQGEVESIVVAQDLNADLILMDERLARNLAQSLGIPFRGVLGVLLDAKRAGLVAAVTPLMDRLIQFGFFVDRTTYINVKQQAGE
jgi:uncharacterized protein